MIIKYVNNIEKVILNLFIFLPQNDKKDIITKLLNDTNYFVKHSLNYNTILKLLEQITNDPFVKQYNKSIYDTDCVEHDKIVEILTENNSYVPLNKTTFKSNYSYCLHRLIVLTLKFKLFGEKKVEEKQIVSYGDIAVIFYFYLELLIFSLLQPLFLEP